MEENGLTVAALPLRADSSLYALVLGSREGMKGLLGSRYEQLERHIDAMEWAVKPEVGCLIGDAGADVTARKDDPEQPITLAGQAVRMLHARWQRKLAGWTLLPCANLPQNGPHLLEAMIACAVEWKFPAGFLRWLVEKNRVCSTVTDCALWLIETKQPLPVPEVEDAICYVPDLAPYQLRRQRMLGGAGVIVAAAGYLCGIDTVGGAMRDELLRQLLGNALIYEAAPCLPMREEGLRYAARVCAYLENACGDETWPAMGENLIVRFVACVLPGIAAYEKRNGTLPVCLCFALSALIMLYAGVRKNQDGEYVLPGESGEASVLDAPAALAAFSRMSCDMPPESLAYAALSDREVWGADLREIEGLEDRVTEQLRDMQLLGARAAMLRAAESCEK